MASFLHIDIISLVQTFGILGILVVVFVESGVFFGFFFPGDSLLFTAGLLASQGLLNIWILLVLVPFAAILGVNFGYWFGKKIGHRLFIKEDSFFFHKHHIERTREFYAKYGVKAIVISRFVPVVRTFTPILAGIGEMPYGVFMKYNILGGILWTTSMILLGYTLGSTISNVDSYLLPIVLVIVVISFLPVLREVLKNKKVKI